VSRCCYLVCETKARGLARMSVMTPRDIIQTREIALCSEHADACDSWFAQRFVPHVTEAGFLYVGDLDELVRAIG
jgi:hypothetical protein